MTDEPTTYACHTCGVNQVSKRETECSQCLADRIGWKENW